MTESKNSRLDIFVVIGLVLLTAAVYGQVGNHSFIQYDDPGYVTENLIVHEGLTWKGFRWAFTSVAMGNWHPLTWLSHMLDVQLFGMKPGIHHLVSVCLHVLNTLLIFIVLRSMTGALWRSAFVAALFALHPLHVESVAWAAERKDVLSTLFWLLTLWAYGRYARKPGLREYMPVLLFFALGLLAKPMLVSLPLVLLLLDYWPLGRLKWEHAKPATPVTASAMPERQRKKRRRQSQEADKPARSKEGVQRSLALSLVYEKIPLFALSAASSIITFYAQGTAVASISVLPMSQRFANAIVSYAAYLWKTVWPSGLAVFYPMETWSAAAVAASAFLLLAWTVAAVRYAGKLPYLMVGWLWYLVTLLPVIGIIKVGDASMADRYTYIPLIGPFIALAWGAVDLSQRLRLPKAALAATSALVISACMLMTYIQIGHWKDSVTLFRHTASVTSRNFMAHNGLAVEYINQKRYGDALPHLQAAMEINPLSPEVNLNLGILDYHAGKNDEAIEKVNRALRLKPGWYLAHEWLGKIYLAKGDADQSMYHFNVAIRTLSDGDASSGAMGQALIFQNRLDEALRYTLQAMETQPRNEKLYNNAGYILIRQGKIDEAIAQFREAVRIAPGYAKAHSNLGAALMQRNRIDEAIQHFETALRLEPGNQSARENLNYALAQQKKVRK